MTYIRVDQTLALVDPASDRDQYETNGLENAVHDRSYSMEPLVSAWIFCFILRRTSRRIDRNVTLSKCRLSARFSFRRRRM